jgi:cobalt/nickel transport system permease protein
LHHAHIDKFAYGDSPVHRLDARVKLLSAIVFTAIVISLPRQSVSILACYAVWPFAMLVVGGIPILFAVRHIATISPFVLVLGLAMPLYAKAPAEAAFGPWHWVTTEGWLRCGAVVGKFVVTMATLIALVSTTRFSDLLAGMERMGMPRMLAVQIGFLYRYIFVLIDRAHHILRARAGRRVGRLGARRELAVGAAMIGSLLIRSVDSAERIGIAMAARGFDGRFRTVRTMRTSWRDAVFAAIFAVAMIVLQVVLGPALLQG